MPKDLDLTEVAAAVTEVKQLVTHLREAGEEREKEMLKKGDFDPLLGERLGKINEAIDLQQKKIDELYVANRRPSLTVDGKSVSLEELDKKAARWAAGISAQTERKLDGEYSAEKAAEYKEAFYSFIQRGDKQLTGVEEKALSVGNDGDGGYFVDPDTSGRVVTRMFDTSPVRRFASVQVITSTSLEGTYDLDEADSGWTNETTAPTETSTPQVSRWSIPVHEQFAEPRITQKLLDDAGIDIEGWLSRKIADKFTRRENTAFVNGNGVNKPRGFLTYDAGTTNPGQLKQFATGVSGNFASDPDGADVLIKMQADLKEMYRSGAVWAMNRTTLGQIRLLKDSQGRMLWQPSIAAGQPSTLLGAPLAQFEDMPSYNVANGLAIAYADFSELYTIVDRLGIRILRDPYTAKPFIKFYATKRVGGDVVNFEAGSLLCFGA